MPDYLDEPRDELSMDQQEVLCGYAAKALEVEVIGQFADTRADLASRPGLEQVLEIAQTQRLDFLIVSSLERLADNCHDAVWVAWHLGRAGTIPLPAGVGCELLPAAQSGQT
ncbi:MAG TPA: recombinase family protein [Solirubrobacteraceae bacterium]|nr:recombinase family protein [Solirubrobacteraceae bacterium]